MSPTKYSARLMTAEDIPFALDYWMNSTDDYLRSMGADPSKMPSRQGFEKMLQGQLDVPMKDKKGLATIWLVNNMPVGHNNVNQINFGKDAKMHLHIWNPENRKKGWGVELLRHSIPHFFQHLQLENLLCEPYALNPAPNRILTKMGFEFIKEYNTTPGAINFQQDVRQYKLSRDKFKSDPQYHHLGK